MPRKHGARPKPTALLKLRGSYNPTLHGRARQFEPIAQGELAEPPPDLTDQQEDIWRYAVSRMPRGVVKEIDLDLFMVWVDNVDRHRTARRMQAMVDRDQKLKLLVRGAEGLAASPYNDILDKTGKMIVRVAQELGFSPAARPSIKADPPTIDAETPAQQITAWDYLRVVKGGKK